MKSLSVVALLSLLTGTAFAGRPEIVPTGLPGLPLDQTFVCNDQLGDKVVSLTGTLNPVVDALGEGLIGQDHLQFVAGTATISISDASPDIFAATGFFQTLAVKGAHKMGAPKFFTGQGFDLVQSDVNPIAPSVKNLVLEQAEVPDESTGELAQVLRAHLTFEGQSNATTLACQVVNFNL